MEIKNRYVIGTHVMWYEIEMYADFVDGLVNLLEPVTNKENVIIDLCFNASQKWPSDKINSIPCSPVLMNSLPSVEAT